jgi:Kef-type K+ transport system membrane component KefB
MHFDHTGLLLFQLLIILSTVKLFGFLFKAINQPAVIGEIIAGIVLGPSLVGALFPTAFGFVFPKESIGTLQQLSQIGLLLFMFIVGMEFDMEKLKGTAKQSLLVSSSSILFPFILGCIFAYFIFDDTQPNHPSQFSFVLFVGISMSVTAFPVLIRILGERSMLQTPIGIFVTGVAAMVDVIAWVMLAAITTIVQGHSLISSIYQVVAIIALLLFAIFVVKPFLEKHFSDKAFVHHASFSLVIICLLLFGLITSIIGIHALFGAFLAGIIMPEKNKIKEKLTHKIEMLTTVLFLPLFFVVTGLRTKINLLNSPELIGLFVIVLLIAFGGKIIGTAIPARMTGKTWYQSWSIGVLMNTRGLMELIVLNLGYDLGVLPESLFTILTLVAIISTVLTSPLLDLINRWYGVKEDAV